ncbi:hypothetical protein [Aquimarina longa]|uniref:hypothetical protein n=1 Tax=Aquimarina longa TaxID=1080221 RepID=UPI00078443C1|nr:hypothetical protein [Aquimarina longa]
MKQMKLKREVLTGKLFDQATKTLNQIINLFLNEEVSFKGRVTGTVLIVFSGALLYLDKIFLLLGINSSINYGFSSFYNFVWVLMQSLAPIFIILVGIYLKPYKFSYLVPLYCYLIQVIWSFNPQYADDFLLTIKYSSGLIVLIIGIIMVLKKFITLFNIKKNRDEEFIQDAKEVLDILKSKILNNNS